MTKRLLVILWHVAALAGLAAFWLQASPSPAAGWPDASAIKRAEGRPTLLMFAHPLNPIARANLHHLARLARETKIDAVVVFYRPRSDASWTRRDAVRAAASTPGVRIAWDDDGFESRRFGSSYCGQALLYDVSGALCFSGDISAVPSLSGLVALEHQRDR